MSYADIQAAHDALTASLEAVSAAVADDLQFRVIGDLSELTDPPAVALAPPSLREYSTIDGGPRVAVWTVAMVVPAGEHVVSGLFALLPVVCAALEGAADAVVTRAEPGVYRAGGTELPAYFITAEVAL